MLIGIVGTICSGKHTTAEYLVQHHGFLRLHLPSRGDHTNHEDKRFLSSTTDQKGTRGLTFPDVDSLLDFVTKRWREHWVLTDIHDEDTLELLLRRPFFLLLNVEAPVSLRYIRFMERCLQRQLPGMTMQEFTLRDDALLYGSGYQRAMAGASHGVSFVTSGIAQLQARAHLQILNPFSSIDSYFSHLHNLDLAAQSRLRPPWDAYFMHLAHLASLRSNCMKRRVGCVLTLNFRILSTGYNGTPRGLTNCNEGGCPRCNNSGSTGGASLSTCLCLHAEENALLEAGRERIREGAVLYCDTCPCLTCSVKIAQVGVKEVVYSQSYNMDEASRRVLAEAGVKLRQYSGEKMNSLVGMDTSAVAGNDAGPSMDLVTSNGT
ncbi:Deoxycytidine monophosphate (dCMP) deaminase [Lithohypha guttulata]|nr:Deoxycytidine monophosphate (dCMP) deaminase [Lithohypha guttulata]